MFQKVFQAILNLVILIDQERLFFLLKLVLNYSFQCNKAKTRKGNFRYAVLIGKS